MPLYAIIWSDTINYCLHTFYKGAYMVDDTGAIEVKNIPQVFQKALISAGVLARTDGNPNDISAKDILEGYRKSAFTQNRRGEICIDDEKEQDTLRNLQKFFSYEYLTNPKKERVVKQDIADFITRKYDYNDAAYNLTDNLTKFKAKLDKIRGAELLAKKNVAVTIEYGFEEGYLENTKIKFTKRSDGGIQIGGRVYSDTDKGLMKDLDYPIYPSKLAKLQEIRFKKIPGGRDCGWAYVMSAVYSDGSEEYIATLSKYTSGPHK